MSAKFMKTVCAILVSSLAVQPAFATNLCVGQVLEVALNPVGAVYANVQGVGMRAYCDVTYARPTTFGSGMDAPIPKEGCSTLYATLLTAKTTGRPVLLYFAADVPNCAQNGGTNGWFTTFPYWVVLTN